MRQPPLLLILPLLLLLSLRSPAQTTTTAPRPPAAFGYRRLTMMFGRDSVQVLLSKPGEEQRKKPLLLWEQGSLPMPLVFYDDFYWDQVGGGLPALGRLVA